MRLEELIQKAREEGYNQGFLDGRNYNPPVKLVGKAKRIQEIVCDYYGVSFDSMLMKNQPMSVYFPKHVLAYQLMNHTRMGASAVGKNLNRDRNTIRNSVKVVSNRIDTEDVIRRDMRILNEKIIQCLHT